MHDYLEIGCVCDEKKKLKISLDVSGHTCRSTYGGLEGGEKITKNTLHKILENRANSYASTGNVYPSIPFPLARSSFRRGARWLGLRLSARLASLLSRGRRSGFFSHTTNFVFARRSDRVQPVNNRTCAHSILTTILPGESGGGRGRVSHFRESHHPLRQKIVGVPCTFSSP